MKTAYPLNPAPDFNAWMQHIFVASKENNNKIMPLNAIWLTSSLQTSTEKTKRIKEGDFVLVENGELKDCTGNPTHRITGCYGTIHSTQLHISVINLKTQELSRIDL